MRRQNSSFGKVVFAIIVVVVLAVVVFKLAGKNSMTESYRQYVNDFEEALIEYSEKELGQELSQILYEYDELESLLINKGYLEEFEDSNIVISADPVTISKTNFVTTYYNYNNTTTLENRFEIKFKIAEILGKFIQ